MDEVVTQMGDDCEEKLMAAAPTQVASAAELIGGVTRSQLEHALDAQRRGLRVYESLRSLNEVIGTQYGDRVLFELLQNAHDAHAEGEKGEVAINLVITNDSTGVLLVANKGRPFSGSNFEAIRNIGTSDKEIGEGIGNKGLGFRSVEALTNDVHIFSAGTEVPAPTFNGYNFRFASTEEIAGLLEDIGASPMVAAKVAIDIPRYLVPVHVAVSEQSEEVRRLAEQGYVTVVCLPLASPREVDLAQRQVAALTDAAAPVQLFLDRLASLEVSIVRSGAEVKRASLSRTVEPLLRDPASSIRMQRVKLGDGSSFLIASQTLQKGNVLAAVKKSIPGAPSLKRWLAWKGDAVVSIAVCLNKVIAPRLYNFLPMDDHAVSPMAGFIDAPFFADIDRRTIKGDLPLNQLLIEAAADTAAKACLAIVDEGLALPPSAVVDMAAWSGPLIAKIVAAFHANGRPLSGAAVWPAASNDGGHWASFQTLYAWPDVRTKQILPARLRSLAEADILFGVSDGQLERIRALADAVRLGLDMNAEHLARWVEATAEHLAKKTKPGATVWRDFYADALALFAACSISLAELVGRKVLLGDEKKLLVATADMRGDAPPVFARKASARNRHGEGAPNPPSAIARKFRFLNQDAGIPEDVVQKFVKAGLLRHYNPVEALEALKGALRSATENQRQEALTWAFRVWLADRENTEVALRAADLMVPCVGGWFVATGALMSASWSSLGGTLEQYLDEAAPTSEDCRGQRNRLLVDFHSWPRVRAHDRREDWTQFLMILGVGDGLQALPSTMRRSGTPSGYWNQLLRYGNSKHGFDANWTNTISQGDLLYPQTHYAMHGEAWRIPGQLEHEQLSESAKELLSNLLVSYLKAHGSGHFQFIVEHWRGLQSVTLPTPLHVFMQHGRWLASARSDEVVFARPSESWSTTAPRLHPPRFVARFRAAPGVREEIPAILFGPKIGLRDWSDPSSAPGRLASLAAALPELSAAERRELRDQVRRAWADVAERRSALPASLQLVVERAGTLELLRGCEQDPPVVYVTSEPQGFAARSLSDAGEPVLDVGETDAPLICDLLKATGRHSPRQTNSSEVQLVVDGVPFKASPDDPPLVAGKLSWLSDLAILAHEHLGNPLETRTLPPDELDRRLRAIRVRRCAGFALTISGLSIPVRGRERVHAVQDARVPTLLVKTVDAIDLPLLLEASQALTKMVGSRRNTLELLLGRLQRDGFDGGDGGPSEELLAGAIGRDVSVVHEYFAATKGGVQRRVEAVLPAVAFLRGREVAERLRDRHAQLGPALQLGAWLAGELPEKVVNQLLEVVAETDDQKSICLRLNLDFAAFGRTLAGLDYPPMNDEADFRRLFSAYVAELASSIRARLRQAFLAAWRGAAPLDEYVSLRTLEFVQFDSQWPLQMEELDRALVVAQANRALEARLGADTPAVELEALEVVVAANRKQVTARYTGLTNLVRAWCRKTGTQQPAAVGSGDAPQLVRELDHAGLLDFEVIAPGALPTLLRRQGWWPTDMPTTESLRDLGLTGEDLKHEENEVQELRLKSERARRSVPFAGRTLDTGSPSFILEFESLAEAAIAHSDEWFKRSRPALLLQHAETGKAGKGASGGGGGRSWRNQPSDATRATMGMASEWLVWKLLFRRHPKEMSDECWVSSNREKFCTGPAGDDSLGYDFRVLTARHEYLYEVKSALDAGGEFELTARELEVAGSARDDNKRKYRILYVPFVFDPTRWTVMSLPNPAGTKTRDQFRVVRSGSVRYRFEQR